MSFKHAYTTVNPNYTDSLVVKISHDCGETWTRVMAVAEDGSNNFITRESINYNFIPSVASDWCGVGFGTACYTIDLLDFNNRPNTKIMFESVSGVGNNLFIDDVRLDILENVFEESVDEKISVYPNPSAGNFNISSDINLKRLDASVYNQQGQKIIHRTFNRLAAGEALNVDLSNHPIGIYFLKLTGENFTESKKLMLD